MPLLNISLYSLEFFSILWVFLPSYPFSNTMSLLWLTIIRYTFIPRYASCLAYKVLLIMVSIFLYHHRQVSLLIMMSTKWLLSESSFHILELYLSRWQPHLLFIQVFVCYLSLSLVSKLNTLGGTNNHHSLQFPLLTPLP